jgi:hypothetical protein
MVGGWPTGDVNTNKQKEVPSLGCDATATSLLGEVTTCRVQVQLIERSRQCPHLAAPRCLLNA